MRRIALIASILVLTVACDKQSRAPESRDAGTFSDLSGNPTILFQVFGPRETPRMAPIAILRDGRLEPISLSEGGWASFDSTYFAAGRQFPVYRNGVEAGALEIIRGMWPADSAPLYAVPGCRRVVPQALARLRASVALEETIELLGSSVPLPQAADPRPFPAGADAQGRTLANAVATASQIGAEDLSSLDFHARWLRTGAGPSRRTLLASYIDPNAGDLGPGAGNTAMVLVLAEDSASAFNTSYQHASIGEARTVEFRRVMNSVDIDNDSISELILEAWRYAEIPSLAVLKYGKGAWNETYRVSLEWCVDRR